MLCGVTTGLNIGRTNGQIKGTPTLSDVLNSPTDIYVVATDDNDNYVRHPMTLDVRENSQTGPELNQDIPRQEATIEREFVPPTPLRSPAISSFSSVTLSISMLLFKGFS